MSQKGIWTIIGIIVVVLIVAGVIYWQYQAPADDTLTDEEQALQRLEESLETASAPGIEVPSANPFQKTAPTKNPLEVTNPFSDGYQNPFE